jgi:hypothetical protein
MTNAREYTHEPRQQRAREGRTPQRGPMKAAGELCGVATAIATRQRVSELPIRVEDPSLEARDG